MLIMVRPIRGGLLLCYNTLTMSKVITRFPPSPTGHMHVGNIRSLLFNYLFAKKQDGEIVMRFEDTDRERSSQEHADEMLRDLEILGLSYDHGPHYQSQRTDIYKAKLQELIDSGYAYIGEATNDGSGNVVRFKNPNESVTFHDAIRGDITIDTTDFGDFVIARSLDNPLYHLTVVVDDIEGGITHVIRGEDHVTSTPRQILLINALGGSVPEYAHLPLIIGDDKKKLGKRHGAVYLQQFLDEGYLPEALINYLALLGWNPGDEREIFTMDELVQEFSLDRVQKSPATFSYTKLQDINRSHMQKLSQEAYRLHTCTFMAQETLACINEVVMDRFIESVLRERITHFGEVKAMNEAGELEYLKERPTRDEELMSFKEGPFETGKELASQALIKIAELEGELTPESIKEHVWEWTSEVGRGNVLHPLRTILSGQKRSPDPFTLIYVLGLEEAIARVTSI